MSSEEAKQYLIDHGMPESKFSQAQQEDAECLNDCQVGDWILISEFEGEYDAKTAIELAEEHQFWSDPKTKNHILILC